MEELANSNALTGLASGEVTFVATSGVMTVAPVAETLVVVSKRASDSAILVNGKPQLDTLKAAFATSSTIKRINLTVGADNTTVIFDYANGTFNANTAPTSPALFGTGGSVVTFGSHTGCTFKIRGTSAADTIYVGQDATPNALISFSASHPDIEIVAGTMPAMGFSLGAGNDTFLATAGAAAFTTVMGAGTSVHSFGSAMTIHGGLGNDTIQGGSAADTIYGEEGYNTVDESTDSATSHVADTVYGLPANENSQWVGTSATTVTYANWAGVAGVTVKLAHLATAIPSGTTDNLDDTIGVVIGSPLADTMQCSQLTDMPCILQGGAGDDTLTPGMSAGSPTGNTHYLYGGDGNDTFVMNPIATSVVLTGGNLTDVMTSADSGVSKNLYTDTVDYSGSSVIQNATISMNVQPPVTCNVADGGNLPCPPNTASPAVGSGLGSNALTFIRNDITVAKCPTGFYSAGLICTVTGNNQGNTIYSGWGSDLLTGGAGDDTFVLANFNPAASYTAATTTKVITGGGGSDTADFSAHTTGTTINLNQASNSLINSGAIYAVTPGERAGAPAAPVQALAALTAYNTLVSDYNAIVAQTTPYVLPTANDTAEKAAALIAQGDIATLSTAISAWVAATEANEGTAGATATAVAAAKTALTTALAVGSTGLTAVLAAHGADMHGSAAVFADATAVNSAATAITTVANAVATEAALITTLNALAGSPTAHDTAEKTAAAAAVTAANALSAGISAYVAAPTAANYAALGTPTTLLWGALVTAQANLVTALAAYQSNATDTVTIVGAGVGVVTVQINALTAVSTNCAGTAAACATALFAAINGNAPSAALVTASNPSAGVVLLTAVTAGAGGDGIGVTVTGTGISVSSASTSGADTAAYNTAAAAIQSNVFPSPFITEATLIAASSNSEQISLVGINNAVCPTSAACVVTSNGNSDTVDFNSDGAISGSSLTCEGSSVLTVNATGLSPNCGE